jgi:4-hydroxy-4-methyl-2-oxoglutarate aldolase
MPAAPAVVGGRHRSSPTTTIRSGQKAAGSVEPSIDTQIGINTTARDMDLLDRFRLLRSAVVSDCLDRLGLRGQAMAPRMRPLYQSARLAGYAMTMLLEPVSEVPDDPDQWYKGELEAIDSLKPGDVVVVSTCQGPIWGELLATASRARGAVGIVADAGVRDTTQLTEMGFPTFTSLITPLDGLGRADVTAFSVAVRCGDVQVTAGDVIVADNDGVIVIPLAAAQDVVRLAEEKSATEDIVREELARGDSTREVFQRYGVL